MEMILVNSAKGIIFFQINTVMLELWNRWVAPTPTDYFWGDGWATEQWTKPKQLVAKNFTHHMVIRITKKGFQRQLTKISSDATHGLHFLGEWGSLRSHQIQSDTGHQSI